MFVFLFFGEMFGMKMKVVFFKRDEILWFLVDDAIYHLRWNVFLSLLLSSYRVVFTQR